MRRIWLSAAMVGCLAVAGASTPAAAEDVQAISTPGKGDLTMCPITFAVYRSCNLYHHIKLPPSIGVGGTVRVRFGSNPKHYNFPVARIVRDGDGCTVFSQLAETENVEKIEIAACGVAPPPP